MTYKIRNWSEIYENNRTREMKLMQWIPIPIKLSGSGYSYLMTQKNGAAMFGCFIAILELAARSEVRGELVRGAGIPHSCQSIARQIRMDESLVVDTIDHCSCPDCDWIVVENKQDTSGCGETAGKLRDGCGETALQDRTGQDTTEQDRTREDMFVRFFDSWNLFADNKNLAKLRDLSKSRKAKIVSRNINIDMFTEILTKAGESDFLMGSTGWKLTFDWIFENDKNFNKILEGNYGNGKPKAAQGRISGGFEKNAADKYRDL